MRKIFIIIISLALTNSMIAQQIGVNKYGKMSDTTSNYINLNGKIGNVPALKKTGAQISISIGDSCLGGIVAYILQSGDSGYISGEIHGLIAAPNDQSAGAEWGCFNYSTTVLSNPPPIGNAIGMGMQNTNEIMAGCSTPGIAARICGDLVLSGYSDWYLPSLDELIKLYLNKTAIGGFSNSGYWSSSEGTAWYAYEYNFNGGIFGYPNKNYLYRVRAIRSF